MRVAIIGQGYVGLTIAVDAAAAGNTVVGFDVNDALVAQLNTGKSPIEGISDKDLAGFVSAGLYRASADASVSPRSCSLWLNNSRSLALFLGSVRTSHAKPTSVSFFHDSG